MGFEEKIKVWLSKGASVSKSAFEKAGDAVQDFSDKSVLKLDKMKLESQKNKKLTELGIVVNDMIANGFSGFDIETVPEKDKIMEIFRQISEFSEKIKEKEKQIEEVDSKREQANRKDEPKSKDSEAEKDDEKADEANSNDDDESSDGETENSDDDNVEKSDFASDSAE